jgi:hypothetical protein
MLATWGISDGNQWAPVIGVLLALVSATWGILHHRNPATPGRLSWSLVRKLANVAGSAAVTYGLLNQDRVASVTVLIAAIGPLLAARYSWVDNSEDATPPFGGGTPLWLMMAAVCCLLLPGCAGNGRFDISAVPPLRIVTPWGSGSKDADGNIAVDTEWLSGSKDALGNVTLTPKAPIVFGTK